MFCGQIARAIHVVASGVIDYSALVKLLGDQSARIQSTAKLNGVALVGAAVGRDYLFAANGRSYM